MKKAQNSQSVSSVVRRLSGPGSTNEEVTDKQPTRRTHGGQTAADSRDTWRTHGGHKANTRRTHRGQASGDAARAYRGQPFFPKREPHSNCLGNKLVCINDISIRVEGCSLASKYSPCFYSLTVWFWHRSFDSRDLSSYLFASLRNMAALFDKNPGSKSQNP